MEPFNTPLKIREISLPHRAVFGPMAVSYTHLGKAQPGAQETHHGGTGDHNDCRRDDQLIPCLLYTSGNSAVEKGVLRCGLPQAQCTAFGQDLRCV